MASRKPLVVIVGQTASGKSAIAVELAKAFNGEIICADARTVYSGMDIGTAKPNQTEQIAVPHHLLDVVSPSDQYTAAQFQADANKAILAIEAKKKFPIVVGGTGMYIDGLVFGYSFLPKTDENIRKKIQQMSPEVLMATLEEQGIKHDPADRNNLRRLQRLLETGGETPKSSGLRQNTLLIGIEASRALLRQRIEKRVAGMLRRGLKYEVADLVDQYGWDSPGLNAIGYREWQPYFSGDISRAEVERRIVRSTLALAKRQRTWFKRHRQINWVGSAEGAHQLVAQFLNK